MISAEELKASLHRAAWMDDAGRITELIATGEDIDELDGMGLTPLHHAAMRGRIGTVRHLLENGACIEVAGAHRSPLHYAATRGDTEIIKLLLCYGARVNVADAAGKTPLYYAVVNGHSPAQIVLKQNHAHGLNAPMIQDILPQEDYVEGPATSPAWCA